MTCKPSKRETSLNHQKLECLKEQETLLTLEQATRQKVTELKSVMEVKKKLWICSESNIATESFECNSENLWKDKRIYGKYFSPMSRLKKKVSTPDVSLI